MPALQATVAERVRNLGCPELVIDGIPPLCRVVTSLAPEGGGVVQPSTGVVGPSKVTYDVCIHQEFAEAVGPILYYNAM